MEQLKRLSNASARFYFTDEFPEKPSLIREWVSPLLNKMGSFLQDPDITAMFTNSKGIDMLDGTPILDIKPNVTK